MASVLDRFVADLARAARATDRPKACFVGTATGDLPGYVNDFHQAYGSIGCEPSDLGLFSRTVADLRSFVCEQDIVYVGGGNTVSLLAVWRAHGLDIALKEAYQAGTILCGSSAGMNCWFEASVTDSYDLSRLQGVHDGLGMLSGSACPHYDGEAQRRPSYHRLVAEGFPGGVAAEDWVALHYVDEQLEEAVTAVEGSKAYRVTLVGNDVVEEPLAARLLENGSCRR